MVPHDHKRATCVFSATITTTTTAIDCTHFIRRVIHLDNCQRASDDDNFSYPRASAPFLVSLFPAIAALDSLLSERLTSGIINLHPRSESDESSRSFSCTLSTLSLDRHTFISKPYNNNRSSSRVYHPSSTMYMLIERATHSIT